MGFFESYVFKITQKARANIHIKYGIHKKTHLFLVLNRPCLHFFCFLCNSSLQFQNIIHNFAAGKLLKILIN